MVKITESICGSTSRRDFRTRHRGNWLSGRSASTSVVFGFALGVYPFLELQPFHRVYYRVLEAFAEGRIRRLIVTMPPQHGKSVGATTLLPAYLLGLDPDLRVAIASLFGVAGLEIQPPGPADSRLARIRPSSRRPVSSREPNRRAISARRRRSRSSAAGAVCCRSDARGLVDGQPRGLLFWTTYIKMHEANSPLIRANCWEWYTSVVRTRMHNASRELIVFTRWHEEDFDRGRCCFAKAGRGACTHGRRWASVGGGWLHLNFRGAEELLRPRNSIRGSRARALWEAQQGGHTLAAAKRRLDPVQFEAMYQRPSDRPRGGCSTA